MLNLSAEELGIMQVLLERLNTHILPRALGLKAKVDRGERLDDLELRLLRMLFEDANQNMRLAKDHPEFDLLIGRIASLYGEITSKALENEETKSRN